MADKKIIKAFECCNDEYSERNDCSFSGKEYAKQMRENAVIDNNGNVIVSEELWQQIANIIETQQEDIERLKRENKILSINADNAFQDGLNEAQDLYAEQVENEVRAEAIKEFADRLGSYKEYRYNENCDFVPYVKLSDIEKTVKEMVGTDNG